jgi:hypothetical protein
MNDMSEKHAAGIMVSHDERTPLIQVVGVRPHRDRYGNHTVSLFACHSSWSCWERIQAKTGY